jgi:hypothetical protein
MKTCPVSSIPLQGSTHVTYSHRAKKRGQEKGEIAGEKRGEGREIGGMREDILSRKCEKGKRTRSRNATS